MSILGSRSESIIGYETGRRTGLIWHTKVGSGLSQESHREVLVADLSTQIFGRAKGATAGAVKSVPRAANDREANTGVALLNPGFDTDTGWTKGTGWTIADGVAKAATGTASDLVQAALVVNLTAYSITFTITDYTAGGVTPEIGGTAGTERTAVGTYTEEIISGAGATVAFAKDDTFVGELDNVSVSVA